MVWATELMVGDTELMVGDTELMVGGTELMVGATELMVFKLPTVSLIRECTGLQSSGTILGYIHAKKTCKVLACVKL